MVDKALVLRKFTELDEYRNQLQEFAGISTQQYNRDWKVQRIVERTLQIMIELCADIANHIIADKRFRTPKSYGDTFKVLEEEHVLAPGISQTMQEMAKFRNIIVHGYDKVDEAIVVGLLGARLGDFLAYRDAITSFLSTES